MKVLSLFDGISCGRLALSRAGIPVREYVASEVDDHAVRVTQARFPDTVQLGDVRGVAGLSGVDLLLGGSPCQGFSFAGRQLNFSDPRSALFFEYVRVLREVKPSYFLLENVKMKAEFSDIISEHLGVQPVLINSSLVSAQNRERLYWTNIPFQGMPADRGVTLRNIIEDGHSWPQDPLVDGSRIHVVRNIYPKRGQNGNVYSVHGKSKTLSAGVGIRGNGIGSSNAPKIEARNEAGWRRLTVTECERLQTVPDGHTAGPSDTQRYKMLGNCWTVDVVAHLLSGISFAIS
jgi:site-specific DNA-cytosine methylase